MRRRNALYTVAEILTPIAVVLGVLLFTNTTDSFYLPPLQEVLAAFRENWLFARVPTDVWPSLFRLLTGYGIAIVLGVGLGLLFGRSSRIRRQAAPVIEFLRAIPPPALLPFTLIALGIDDPAKIFLIAFVCVWPILLNTMDGVVGLESTMRETGLSYRIPGLATLLHVELRAASPQIFAGMRASLPLAIIIMVVSEMVGARNGIGYFIVQAQRTFAIPDMWSGIILLGVLGYALNLVFTLVERRVLAWHIGSHAAVH